MRQVNRRWVLQRTLATGLAYGVTPAPAQPARRPLEPAERATLAAIANKFLKTYQMPGLSVAIAQHGRMVYAEGFGLADTSTGEKVAAEHLFRVASLSKPITSVGVFSLLDQAKLKLTDKVFGTGGILGSESDIPSQQRVQNITVGHLLLHLGGGWSNKPDDPMDSYKTMNHHDLISWTLEKQPLDNPPGTKFAYSNFGYCVLGRVIEKVSRQTYENYIRSAVLLRCGISRMRIAGSSRAQRADGEVAYHHRSVDPYTINMARNDSTGGWLGSATDLTLFATHVSGFPYPPNILAPATIMNMTTPSAANPRYAHGWSVLKGNWRHDGLLPGTTATLVRTGSGYCWTAVTNSSNKNGNRGLDNMVWEMVRSIEHWSPGEPPHRQG
jgi:CubicO group peptidase (beta-lactamase class C family)